MISICVSIWRTDTVLVFPDYRTVCMSPDLLGLERWVCIVMTGKKEGSGIMPIYT